MCDKSRLDGVKTRFDITNHAKSSSYTKSSLASEVYKHFRPQRSSFGCTFPRGNSNKWNNRQSSNLTDTLGIPNPINLIRNRSDTIGGITNPPLPSEHRHGTTNPPNVDVYHNFRTTTRSRVRRAQQNRAEMQHLQQETRHILDSSDSSCDAIEKSLMRLKLTSPQIVRRSQHVKFVCGACLINSRGTKCLLVLQKDAQKWSFPKGSINRWEKDYDCMTRELMEETGLDLNKIAHHSLGDYYNHCSHIFVFKLDCDEEALKLQTHDNIEIADVQWVSIPAMRRLSLNCVTNDMTRKYLSP